MPAELPTLPHNPDAERAFLGALLNGYSLNAAISCGINTNDFFLPFHRIIYSELLALHGDHSDAVIDLVTFNDWLSERGKLAAAGGTAYVSTLGDDLAQLSHAPEYARLIKEKSHRRKLMAIAERVQRRSGSGEDVAELEKELATLRALPANGNGNGNGHHLTYSLQEFMSTEFPEPEHLIEGVIPRFGSVLVLAKPHRLKSYLTTALALQATRAGTILGFLEVRKPVRTLLCQVEDFPGEVKKRIGAFLMTPAYGSVDIANVRVLPRHKGVTIDAAWYARLEKEAQEFKPDLIILDVLRRVFHRGDLNSPKDSAVFLEDVDQLRDNIGCSVCLVHHENKKDSEIMDAAAGSYNFPGWANVLIHLKRKTVEGEITHVEVEIDNKVGMAPEPLRMTLNFAAPEPVLLAPLDDQVGASEAEDRLGSEWDIRTLGEVLEVHRATAYRRLKKWIATGRVEKITSGKRGRTGGLARYRFLTPESINE